MSKPISEVMAQESADWYHRGFISAETSERLAARYDREMSALSVIGRWLGIFAVLLLCGSVLALIAISGNVIVTGIFLLLFAIGFWVVGIRMATGKDNRFPVTGSALVTVSFMALFGTLMAFSAALDELWNPLFLERYVSLYLLIVAFCAIITAYLYGLRWPLFLGVLLIFHAAGSYGWYGGSGSYFFTISHPPSMAGIAAVTVLCGLMHRNLEADRLSRYAGFGQIMILLGLVYLNCSLWFMSIGASGDYATAANWRVERLFWLLLFTGSCIGQLVIGAFLADRTFLGFGIVFLSIDLYTQFFERFWDKLSAATFFVVVGIIAMALGYLFETLHRRQLSKMQVPEGGPAQ